MFNKLLEKQNIEDAYNSTMKGNGKYKSDVIRFGLEKDSELEKLVNEIKDGSYYPSGYTQFTIKEPKERIIYAPYYRDKIVHHMVNNVLRDYYEPLYIRDSYACIRGKGHLSCVDAIQKHLRIAKRNMRNPYIIKADISKFFYSIDRVILKIILMKKIKCPRFLDLCFKIIDSSPTDNGLPLGNLTSQQFANIFLNEIDQYCKRTLRLKHYCRYADDFFIVVDGKERAKEVVGFLRNRLDGLSLKIPIRKVIIKPLEMGFHGLGVKIYATHIELNSRTKRRTERYIRNLYHGGTIRQEQQCSSCYSHINNFSSRNFMISMLSKYQGIAMIPAKKQIINRRKTNDLL